MKVILNNQINHLNFENEKMIRSTKTSMLQVEL
jgi:hypothetical protein